MQTLDWQQILSQAISFAILLWLLKRFAWKPLLGILDQRRALIQEDLRAAAQQKADVVRLQHEYAQRLTKIEEEARAKIQHAVLEGKRIAVEIQEQARAQGQTLLAKSKETIELEIAKARVTLRDQMAAMTVEAVERVLKQKLDPATDRALVETVLDELASKT